MDLGTITGIISWRVARGCGQRAVHRHQRGPTQSSCRANLPGTTGMVEGGVGPATRRVARSSSTFATLVDGPGTLMGPGAHVSCAHGDEPPETAEQRGGPRLLWAHTRTRGAQELDSVRRSRSKDSLASRRSPVHAAYLLCLSIVTLFLCTGQLPSALTLRATVIACDNARSCASD